MGFSSRIRALCALWCGFRGDRERLAGRYEQAERHIRRGLALARRAYHPDEVRIRLLNSLGMVCKYEGRHDQGARAYRRALRLAERRLPIEHPIFACLFHNIAGLEHARERFDLAESFARRGLVRREARLGSLHPDVGRDLAALAAILDGQGRHTEAEPMHRRALRIFEQVGRQERREIAYTMGNLAACMHLMGRDDARAVARTALGLQIRSLGAEHPDVRVTRSNLAAMEAARKEE